MVENPENPDVFVAVDSDNDQPFVITSDFTIIREKNLRPVRTRDTMKTGT